MPGQTAHTFWNPRPDPARYLLIMGADTFALIQAIHATDDRSPARMRQRDAAHAPHSCSPNHSAPKAPQSKLYWSSKRTYQLPEMLLAWRLRR